MIVSFVGVYGGHYSEHCRKVTLVCCWLCACTLCVCFMVVVLVCLYIFVNNSLCVCVQSQGKLGPQQLGHGKASKP